jgi:hypothetical protein
LSVFLNRGNIYFCYQNKVGLVPSQSYGFLIYSYNAGVVEGLSVFLNRGNIYFCYQNELGLVPSQSYDFLIYSYNANAVVGFVG